MKEKHRLITRSDKMVWHVVHTTYLDIINEVIFNMQDGKVGN